jgi:hypothetical protein
MEEQESLTQVDIQWLYKYTASPRDYYNPRLIYSIEGEAKCRRMSPCLVGQQPLNPFLE